MDELKAVNDVSRQLNVARVPGGGCFQRLLMINLVERAYYFASREDIPARLGALEGGLGNALQEGIK
jgi:hypothetical protein